MINGYMITFLMRNGYMKIDWIRLEIIDKWIIINVASKYFVVLTCIYVYAIYVMVTI